MCNATRALKNFHVVQKDKPRNPDLESNHFQRDFDEGTAVETIFDGVAENKKKTSRHLFRLINSLK